MVKVKDKERILKAAREKQLGKPHKAISLFHQKVYESEGSDTFFKAERKEISTLNSMFSENTFRNKGKIKTFSGEGTKRISF